MKVYTRWYYFKAPSKSFPNMKNFIEYNFEFKLFPNISIEGDKNGFYSYGKISMKIEWLFWQILITLKNIKYE